METVKRVFKKVCGVVGLVQYNAPVVLTFTFIAMAALLVNYLTGGWANAHIFSVYRSSPADPLFYLRFFGYVFGHAGFDHFFGNFLMILLAGPMLEEKYGSKKMAVMITVTVLATGILHVAFSDKAALGASGVVFMLILLSSFANLKRGRVPLTLLLCVAVYIGREVMAGLTVEDNVSRFGHIFGGLMGAGFGVWLNKETLFAGVCKGAGRGDKESVKEKSETEEIK